MRRNAWVQEMVLEALAKKGCMYQSELKDLHPQKTAQSIAYAVNALAKRGLVRTSYEGYRRRVCITRFGLERVSDGLAKAAD